MATRRGILAGAMIVPLLVAETACNGGSMDSGQPTGTTAADPAVLTARPGTAEPGTGTRTGVHALGVATTRDPIVFVPESLATDEPVPLLVALHGAGGDAQGGLSVLRAAAEELGIVILAPASRAATWDAIRGGYGPDTEVINRALEEVFSFVTVDPDRIGVAGFSDGASYALGLGLANGDLFSKVVAFSPGFVPAGPQNGQPAIFISHGTEDAVLPIDATSRRVVPTLKRRGYEVVYREFDGPHTVPSAIAVEAGLWLEWTPLPTP
ncbi:alpha/beta hydrolase [Arthrobacter sedimenti]|uniref:alpha/beta hydrolase n=1 Tax=Arthrobacter sedimenti TaxID=2694931 RepID=UPI001ABFE7C8|nr:PHB depolymerase family esterase [Arthrobacter sedimenti]